MVEGTRVELVAFRVRSCSTYRPRMGEVKIQRTKNSLNGRRSILKSFIKIIYALFLERVQIDHSSFLYIESPIPKTRSNMPTPNVPICHQKSHHVFSSSFLYRMRVSTISSSGFPCSRILATFAVARKLRKRLITHQIPNPEEAKKANNESKNAHLCQETGSNFSFRRVVI